MVKWEWIEKFEWWEVRLPITPFKDFLSKLPVFFERRFNDELDKFAFSRRKKYYEYEWVVSGLCKLDRDLLYELAKHFTVSIEDISGLGECIYFETREDIAYIGDDLWMVTDPIKVLEDIGLAKRNDISFGISKSMDYMGTIIHISYDGLDFYKKGITVETQVPELRGIIGRRIEEVWGEHVGTS